MIQYFFYMLFRSNKILRVFWVFLIHYNLLLAGYNELILRVHYNQLFSVWLIMNLLMTHIENKPILLSPFYSFYDESDKVKSITAILAHIFEPSINSILCN